MDVLFHGICDSNDPNLDSNDPNEISIITSISLSYKDKIDKREKAWYTGQE